MMQMMVPGKKNKKVKAKVQGISKVTVSCYTDLELKIIASRHK